MNSYERFESLCEAKKITPYRVCKDLGWGTATTSNWKAGKSVLKQEKMKMLADYFLVDVEYITTNAPFALCPICRFVYDPMEEVSNALHDSKHDIFLKACRSFGQINDYIEINVMNPSLKEIFTDVAYNKYSSDEYEELCDDRLDHEFSKFIWYDVTTYAFSNETDERKYRWEWKRFYVEENIKPSQELSLEVCNVIRRYYEVKEITPEEVIENSKDFLYNLYKSIIVEDQAEHYFKLFINLPPERRRNIYEQIVFQSLQMNKEEGEE